MNFKSASIAFIISVFIICLLYYFSLISLWWLILPIVIYKSLIIYGSATIQSNFFTNAFCNAVTSEKIVAITFDDGPNNKFTPKVLSTLAEFDAKATFFVIGKNINGNENIIKQIDSGGHILGNHTFSHSFFIDFKSANGFKEELNKTSDEVFKIMGKRMKLFRPPYGVTTPGIAKASRELSYNIIGWNIRSLDTTNDNEEIITARVLKQIKSGAILLFHDTSEKTINVLKQTLTFAKQNGYKIVSLQQLLEIENYK